MITKKEINYLLSFGLAVILTLLMHYLFISKINLHSTMHVGISLIILWIFLSIIASITKK